MKWPELVPDRVCTTPIIVYFTDGFTKDGEPNRNVIFDGNCNWAEQSREVLSADRSLVTLSATALFNGDIYPEKDITGEVEVHGIIRRVHSASRARNLDGTVNYTRLELE